VTVFAEDFVFHLNASKPSRRIFLRRSNGLPSLLTSLSGIQSRALGNTQLLRLGNRLFTFRQDQFDVAWVGHVWVDTTVGTVCSAALLGCLVHLDALDNQVGSIETLGIGVGLGVLEQAEKELGGLDWVTRFGNTELLALSASTSASSISSHRDSCLQFLDILEILDGAF